MAFLLVPFNSLILSLINPIETWVSAKLGVAATGENTLFIFL